MDRRVDFGRTDQARAELPCPRVQAPELCCRNGLVQGVPQELVAEVVVALVHGLERIQEGARHELVEGCVEIFDRAIHHAGQDLRREAAAHHGAGQRDGLGLVRQAREPGQDRVLDRVRDLGIADRAAVGPRLVAERAEELLDVQRDAVAALVDRVDDRAGSRQATAEDQRRHESRLVVGQRLEARLLGEPLAEQPRPPLSMEGAERKLISTIGAQQQQRTILSDARKLADDLDAQLVGPLQILEDEQCRPVDGGNDQLRDVAHEDPSRAQRVPATSTLDRQQGRLRGHRTRPGRSSSARGRAPKPAEPGGPAAPDRPWPAGTRQPRPWPGSPEPGGSFRYLPRRPTGGDGRGPRKPPRSAGRPGSAGRHDRRGAGSGSG